MEPSIDPDTPDAQGKAATPKSRAGPPEKVEYVHVNWARKPHTSDRIPIPSMANLTFNEDRSRVILEDQTSYGQNEYVFVAPQSTKPPAYRDDINYAPPRVFRIARIMSFQSRDESVEVRVNWLYRPQSLAKHPGNSRELYATFETGVCSLTDFRGKCTVSNKLEIRNHSRFCDKPSQFWVSQLFDPVTQRLYDVIPVTSLKSLGPNVVESIGHNVQSVVVLPEHTKKLCESQRKRKPPQTEQTTTEPEAVTLEKQALRNEWPFRYFDISTSSVWSHPGLPKPSCSDFEEHDRHVHVPDWPGKSLVYYTMAAHNPASGKSQKLRLLEAEDGKDMWDVDTSLPWVQQMPRGYIGRGNDATATEVSLPLSGITDFIQACQSNYSAQLGVEPNNLNFLDACCKVFTANRGDENKALVEVSRFTRRSIGEPELTSAEKDAFEAAMNPFLKNSWHDVFLAVRTKPIADLSQYFWSQRPASAVTSADDEFWETDPEPETSGIQCAICLSEDSSEWKHLPGYVPIPAGEFSEDPSDDSVIKKAMCSRCARLWLRYQANWLPCNRVEELEADGHPVEAELVEDAKAVRAEDERRRKRRIASQEKQEALSRKRERARQEKEEAKAEAKASGKTAKAPPKKKAKAESLEPEPEPAREELEVEEPQQQSQSPQEQPSEVSIGPKPEGTEEPQDDSETEAGPQVRRRQNTTQLSLNAIDDDFINSLIEDTAPELSSISQNCVVCGQIDASMAQETCASCGLRVHTSCYGPGSFSGSGPWLCDCCVNSRSGLGLDAFYQCAVCPPKQPTYARWLSGEPVGASDALKGTVDKTWCHIRCAVWIRNISFLNPANLEGIDLARDGLPQSEDQCAICLRVAEQAEAAAASDGPSTPSSKSTAPPAWAQSGVRLHCDICNEAFHVSCAAEQGYFFGFLRVDSGTPTAPVIRCKRHGASNIDLRPMSYINPSTDSTVLQDYVRAQKKSTRDGTITAAERARIASGDELLRAARRGALDTSLTIGTTGLQVARKRSRCVECGNRNAVYWLSTIKGLACPLCYRHMHWSASRLADWGTAAMQDGLSSCVDAIFKANLKTTN